MHAPAPQRYSWSPAEVVATIRAFCVPMRVFRMPTRFVGSSYRERGHGQFAPTTSPMFKLRRPEGVSPPWRTGVFCRNPGVPGSTRPDQSPQGVISDSWFFIHSTVDKIVDSHSPLNPRNSDP
jgi:hypothetical protein